MLPFRVFTRFILATGTNAAPAASAPILTPHPSAPIIGQTVWDLVTPDTPTARCIPFIFNKLACRRSRRRTTGGHISLLFSSPSRPFSFQQGGTPPSHHSLSLKVAPTHVTFPRTPMHRILDFPHPRVSFGNKGGFFIAFSAAPQVLKFICIARSH
jgi:hypothetical protein